MTVQGLELVDVLNDRERFGELARFLAAKSSRLHAEEARDPNFGLYLKAGLDLLIEENLRLVFDLTESPIETIFVNSLLLAFIKSDPLNLVIQHSVRNAPRQIEGFRQRREQSANRWQSAQLRHRGSPAYFFPVPAGCRADL